MAVEAKRGCGYRKAGGLYLSGGLDRAIPVYYLPFCIENPHSRGVSWNDPKKLLWTCADEDTGGYRSLDRVALMWVGATHYTTATFLEEAKAMGVSKRVAFVPNDLKPGDPIALAHIAAIKAEDGRRTKDEEEFFISPHCHTCRGVPGAKAISRCMSEVGKGLGLARADVAMGGSVSGDPMEIAGIFCLFKMKAVEIVLPKSVANNPVIQRKCAERGVNIVPVPDNDKDHIIPGWKLPKWLNDDQSELPGIIEGAA